MSHKPTQEQAAVIDAFRSEARPTIVVQAGAGCGKSSTLKMAAATTPNRKGLYVAYNKALATEARESFPAAVDCRTAHSLAFGPVGRHYRDRLNGPRVPAKAAAEFLGFNSPVQIAGELAPLIPTTLARLTLEQVGRFLNSADPEPGPQHGPRVDGYSPADNRALGEWLTAYARKAWDDLQLTSGGRLKFTHDVYLKLYQLSRPRIPADFVLLDEGQDLSPVMLSLFHFQDHAQRIMVGDSAQAIYGFRGAIDALAKFQADVRLTLSQSFRFGPAVADEANRWLDLLDAPLRLRGFEPAGSVVGPAEAPDAILCRSNAGAIAQVMAAVAAGRRPALVGGGDEIRRLAEAAQDLMDGRPTSHPELVAFRDWDQVCEHAAHDEASGNLKVLVKLVNDHGPEQIIRVVGSLVSEAAADVTVSTAHKAKGREWDAVRIAGDFREPRVNPVTNRAVLVKDELMLAYVAVTRARRVLDRQGLAWVDWFAAGRSPRRHDPAAIMPDPPAETLDDVAVPQFPPPVPDRCPDCCAGYCAEHGTETTGPDRTAEPLVDTAPDRIDDLIEASSLGTPEARALREQGRSVLAPDLTGMPEEQADWAGDPEPLVDTAYGPLPAHEAAQLAEHGYVTCRCALAVSRG